MSHPDDLHVVAAKETRLAIVNSIKLSFSLLGTLVVAFFVRFLIPRYVGPSAFGQLNFADAYAMSFFAFTTFGIDSYIAKEVAKKIDHASDFYAGSFVLRLVSALGIFVLMAMGLLLMHKDSLAWRLVFIFSLGQICFVINVTLTALLHAASQVNELAWMNVFSKILWGIGIYASLVLHAPLESIAVCFFISEAIKALYLSILAKRKLSLQWRIDMSATWAVIVASFPFFLNVLAHRMYEKLNINMLSVMTNDQEVGWFSAAVNIATISLLFLPILQAVIMPMASRTAIQSMDAMHEIMRGATRLVVVLGTLISVMLMLHADWIVAKAFGANFAPSAISLRMIAPMFPLTYMAFLGALHLIQLNRIWDMIKISVIALLINPVLNAPLIFWGFKMGPGYAGGLSAVASIATEGLNAVLTLVMLKSAAVDKRLWQVLLKTILICGGVIVLHEVTKPIGLWQIPLEVCSYISAAILCKALPWGQVQHMLHDIRIRSFKKGA